MLGKVILWLLSWIPHIMIERPKGTPYLTRYYLLGGPRDGLRKYFPWNVYLHCFHASDEPVPHNHPWEWAKSLILMGAYLEHRIEGLPPCTSEARSGKACPNHSRIAGSKHERFVYTPGKWNTLHADSFHWVDLITPTVWTLFITGPRMSPSHEGAWGWQTPQGYVPEHEYKKAHHL
jgi:hypothetical protein